MAGFNGESRVEVELVWHDDVLLEIDVRIITPDWRGHETTYTTEEDLLEFARQADAFATGANETATFQAGYADRPPTINLLLRQLKSTGQIGCIVDLSNTDTIPSLPETPFKISAVIATEAEAVRRFSRQLDTMIANRNGVSVLLGE